jgi:hypothetical protein
VCGGGLVLQGRSAALEVEAPEEEEGFPSSPLFRSLSSFFFCLDFFLPIVDVLLVALHASRFGAARGRGRRLSVDAACVLLLFPLYRRPTSRVAVLSFILIHLIKK